VKVIDTVAAQELFQHPLFNPEPPDVVAGRPFLYDAQSSSNGEASCASCHARQLRQPGMGSQTPTAW
jgi:cytochrome c peroxidase